MEQQLEGDEIEMIRKNYMDFKKTSVFQSSIICFLVGFERNKDEKARLTKQFQAMDKD